MSIDFEPDEFVERGDSFFFRGGVWTNATGMRLSLTESQQMTQRFFAEHGRSPRTEPPPPPRTRKNSKAAKKKADALRAAIAKAQSKPPPDED